FLIELGPLRAFVDKLVELFQLGDSNSTLQVSHPVVESHQVEFRQDVWFRAVMALLLRYGSAVISESPDEFGDSVVIRRDHTSFTRGHGLARMEGEASDRSECSGRGSFVSGTCGACSVFD